MHIGITRDWELKHPSGTINLKYVQKNYGEESVPVFFLNYVFYTIPVFFMLLEEIGGLLLDILIPMSLCLTILSPGPIDKFNGCICLIAFLFLKTTWIDPKIKKAPFSMYAIMGIPKYLIDILSIIYIPILHLIISPLFYICTWIFALKIEYSSIEES